jgi:chromosome segregation ATPase
LVFLIENAVEPSSSTEQMLLADIAALRERFTNTQELYREVCTLMFFRYGITPTANKLYQYVKKGSMSAPTEALAKFWGNLREKSRVRIEHPDLPEQIKSQAGELAAALWDQAQGLAKDSFAAHWNEARAVMVEAQTAQAKAEAERDRAVDERSQLKADLETAREQLQALQQQRAADLATRELLDEQLARARADIAAHRQAQESTRQYFAAEIEKLRSEAQLSEERFRASEKRALMEIDRERSATVKLEKDLANVRAEAVRVAEQYRLELQESQQQVGDVRQRVGELEGQLQAAKVQVEQRTRETHELQKQLTEAVIRAAASDADRNRFRLQAESTQKEVEHLKDQLSKRRLGRTSSVRPKGQ